MQEAPALEQVVSDGQTATSEIHCFFGDPADTWHKGQMKKVLVAKLWQGGAT